MAGQSAFVAIDGAQAASPRLSKAERTRESVLATAEVLFSEHGFDATTLDAIGDRVGIQGTAILYHYATKRELYEAVLDRIFAPLLVEVHRHLATDAALSERLGAITSTMVRFAAARPGAARLFLREAIAGSAEAGDIITTATRRQSVRFFDALGKQDGANYDPLVVWNIVVGAICFYFAAGPTVGGLPDGPADPARAAAFETMMVDITGLLCGSDREPHNA
jgi:TetR/AcrR family transcriptional regulator